MNLYRKIVRFVFSPRQLRCLYRFPRRSREFELAFGKFYDDVKHERIVDGLHGARLQEFVDFMDEVRRSSYHSGHRLTTRSGATIRRIEPRIISEDFVHFITYLQ